MRKALLRAVSLILAILFMAPGDLHALGKRDKQEAVNMSALNADSITITVTYDNNKYMEGLETSWGFSCLITGTERSILFDTGEDGTLLLRNMDRLGIDPATVDVIVLSHIHGDHTGGLDTFFRQSNEVTVYLPSSFPQRFKENVRGHGAEVIEVDGSRKISRHVFSTGPLGTWIKEQTLTISTDRGLVVITGCAHPGIVNIVKRAQEVVKNDLLLVMGGFHLGGTSKKEIENIVSAFRQMEVRHVGPSHCTGDAARTAFEEEYGRDFLRIGAGRVIKLKDL